MSGFDTSSFTLTPFQDEDATWLHSHHKALLLYDRGLGKTVVETKRLIDEGVGTHLVVCPANAIGTWEEHTVKWWQQFRRDYDVDIQIVRGDPYSRKYVWDQLLHSERTKQHRLFVTTYHTFQRDVKNLLTPRHLKHVDHATFDEAHKLRNRKSVNFKLIDQVCRSLNYYAFLTGTPISRGPQEFWTLLHCCNRKYFSSYWALVNAFCEVVEGGWGQKEIIGPKNLDNFYALLNQYARIRLKTDPIIAEQMPKQTRSALYTELDNDQYRLYQELDLKKISITPSGDVVVAGTSMELVMRLRQLLVCPRIFDDSLSLGGAFQNLLDDLEDMDPIDQHTVIFTPFKRAFPHFRKELERRGHQVFQLSGGISSDEQRHQIQEWRRHKGIMLCTITYAESFSLEPAKASYFIGYEWDPNANVQAEDRLMRLTTSYPVTNYYYRYRDTVDDAICYTVNWKNVNISTIMKGGSAYVQG